MLKLIKVIWKSTRTQSTLEPEIPGAPTLEGYDDYNKVQPIINKVANEMNFDSLILASIVLTESRGDTNAKRHETNRYEQIKSASKQTQNINSIMRS